MIIFLVYWSWLLFELQMTVFQLKWYPVMWFCKKKCTLIGHKTKVIINMKPCLFSLSTSDVIYHTIVYMHRYQGAWVMFVALMLDTPWQEIYAMHMHRSSSALRWGTCVHVWRFYPWWVGQQESKEGVWNCQIMLSDIVLILSHKKSLLIQQEDNINI